MPLLNALPVDPLEAAQIQALNYMFRGDEEAGRAALATLEQHVAGLGDSVSTAGLRRQLGWLSVMTMLQAHSQWRTVEETCFVACLKRQNGTRKPLKTASWRIFAG